jgi:transcriptional regulator of arginine metabolism
MNKHTDGSKRERQRQILALVGGGTVPSQEELRRRLGQRGVRVTQATLSRDLRELGLVKTPTGYALPSAIGSPEPALPSLDHLLREFVHDIREAQNLLVLKTSVGSAQPIGLALDQLNWPEIVGTVAGDDTVLVITADRKSCRAVALRLREKRA